MSENLWLMSKSGMDTQLMLTSNQCLLDIQVRFCVDYEYFAQLRCHRIWFHELDLLVN